ncbi:hypothetical protein [Streptomyces jumonjinensis]|uniref:hypothetical protein n=1 Tax=Streptomyces jumonjinensis TaxID=1945 RepID=UPI003787E8D4
MPRGRHRHSPPLHRLLPPTAVAGAAVLCAAGAWLLTEPFALRALVTATAVAAVTGAVLMRMRDRSAGRQVADLTRGRANDAWRTEERIAALESALEDSRDLRAKADAKLRAKRVELAALRNEHADLLRRYATAETERASALEGRRQLAIDAGAPKAPAPAGTTPAAYLRAAKALENLTRAGGATGKPDGPEPGGPRAGKTDEPPGKGPGKGPAGTGAAEGDSPAPALPARRAATGTAAAIVPYGPGRGADRSRPDGGFDYFGTQAAPGAQAGPEAPGPARQAIEAVQQEDLADVVGEEALAERGDHPTDTARPAGDVIDLTAHDETEKLDLGELRNAVGS